MRAFQTPSEGIETLPSAIVSISITTESSTRTRELRMIHWAGTETAIEQWGSMDGAISAAERSVDEVLA